MRAGYVALLSVVLTYSAYQGTHSPPGRHGSETNPSASEKQQSPARAASPLVGPDSFPTIAGGICPLNFDKGDPCDGCKSICPSKDLKNLIGDYFRGQSGKDDDPFLQSHWNVPPSQQEHIQFIFASTPDPVHTHVALVFDREIETIQSAAQSAGFLFARAWMPWDISTHNESTDFTIRLAQSKFREQIESLPGLMIFQKFSDKGPPTILFVFITGETSTGGMHIEQFENALKIRTAILAGVPHDHQTLRIFGPVFSGSLRSLNVILNTDARQQFDKIVVRSGSVSSEQALRQFRSQIGQEWPDLKTGIPPADQPDFETLQVTDAYQDYYLNRYLCKFANREGPHFNLAVLSEDETAFGNMAPPATTKNAKVTATPSSGTSSSCDLSAAPDVHGLLRLYYPRGIAQLRDAYQQNLKSQAASESGKAPPQNGLPLSLSVTGNDDDTVSPFSPLQTPLSQDSILQGIVITLRMKHAKVVLIRAGDPLDVVFLAHYLRQSYPQARLVTVGADLLMIHAFFDPQFHGILAVTSYPLLSGADFPTSGAESGLQRVFPDSYSIGNFNALQYLLALGKEPADKQIPSYAQIGLPSFMTPLNPQQETNPWRAHLWLTAIGRDGYWPVAVLDDWNQEADLGIPSVEQNAAAPVPETYSVHFSLGWTLFSTLAFCFTCLLAVLLAFPRQHTRSEVLARFGLQNSPERNGLLFTTGTFLLAVQVVLVVPSIFWLGRFSHIVRQGLPEQAPEYFNGLPFNMLSYLISVGALGIGCYIGFKKRGAPRFAQIGSALCAVFIVIVGVVTLSIGFWSAHLGPNLDAFVYRYVQVGSGVSPLPPAFFLLSAWIWWCWQSLTGVVSTAEKQIVLPSKSSFDRPFALDASSRVRLKMLAVNENEWPWKNLRCIPGREMIGFAFLALAIILIFMRPDEVAEAFESPVNKRIFWVLLYSCLFLVLYLAIHIVALWLDFRSLLRHIEMVPFRRGFGALKSLTWKPLWKLAGNGRDQFVQLLREEVDALIQIQNSGLTHGALHRAIVGAEGAMKDVCAEFESHPASARIYGLFHELQVSLANTASEALIYADERWQKEPYTPPANKSDSKDSREDCSAFKPAAQARTLAAVEHFLCLFYLNIILVPLRRLQTLILALAGVFIFVLVSYSSYPFESRESFHALLISIFFGISLVVGIVYGQMFANPLLSRITNTKPGELGLDFWVRLGTFVFIPLLSLLSVQFPEINNFLFSWLQPALQSIK